MDKVDPNHPKTSLPRIAIPVPHSGDREYAERAMPQYEAAVRQAGGEPVRIELNQPDSEVVKQVDRCDGILLPGSKADVAPESYNAARNDKTDPADARRDAVDRLLLQDAYGQRKPVLGICYGLQSLNVFRSGTLVQDIESKIDHAAGRAVPKAHTVTIEPNSLLAEVIGAGKLSNSSLNVVPVVVPVNSSHHQSADKLGKGLRVVASCSEDGVIEAVEGTAPEHFVLAVQWHPERSVNDSPELASSAQSIFRAFVEAAATRDRKLAAKMETS
jgi:putative glutamine amidotransferase